MTRNLPKKKKDEFQFEEALERLEELTRSLESGDLSLDESLAAYEEGIRLRTLCTEFLGKAEKRLQALQTTAGATRLVNLTEEADDESSLF